MMRIALRVKYEDGREQHVKVSAPDLIAFERTYDKPTSAVAEGRLEYLWWVAWHSAHRTKQTELPFDEWIGTIDEISDDDAKEREIVPLESTPLTG